MTKIIPLAAPVFLALSVPREDYDFWSKQADKWGIALVSLVFFAALAVISWKAQQKRERALSLAALALQKKEDEREARAILREDTAQAERVGLLKENNGFQMKLIEMNGTQTQAIKDQTRASEDLARSMKDMIRKVNCPKLPQ